MSGMFYNCKNLETIYASPSFSNGSTTDALSKNMFGNDTAIA
jgi:hypothetical protein